MILKEVRFVLRNIVCVGLNKNEIRVGIKHIGKHERCF